MNNNLENNQPQMSAENTPAPVKKKKKKKYKGFTFKQRLVPTILLSLVAPLTVFVFGPFEVYRNNIAEFSFALGDFFWWNILFCVLSSGIICAALLPLKKRVFDIAYAAVAWLSVMLFVQGNYLNFGLTSLEGDGLGSTPVTLGAKLLNVFIWLAVGALLICAVIFIKKKYREYMRLGFCILMVTVIGMQALTCAVVLMTSEDGGETAVESGDVPDTQYLLTYENMDKLGEENNVIYFVIDRLDWEYYEDARERCPEIFYNLDSGGFTHFDDATSLYPRTFPSVSYMFTGIEHDFEDSRLNYFASSYSSSPFLETMKESGYTINFYTDNYYGYDNAYYMKNYVSNITGNEGYDIDSNISLSFDMSRLSLYRYLPTAAKKVVGGISTPDFEKHMIYHASAPKYSTDMRDLYNYLGENELKVDTNIKKNFSFIHLSGTHAPLPYDKDFNAIDDNHPERYDAVSAMQQSFKIINRYIDQMKELGMYEDATIIITGDHASIGSDTDTPLKWAYITPLFVKPAGVSDGELDISSAPVCHEDIFATIIKSEGIETDRDFGKSVFEFSEGEERVRKFYFQRQNWTDGKSNYEQFVYEIVGSAKVYENWKLRDSYYIGKDIYE